MTGLPTLEPVDVDSTDEVELQQYFHERDMTDGLPVIAPTAARVEAFLAATGLDPDDELGAVDPGRGIATVANVAVNCLMAGCKPEHVPVVIASIEAMLKPEFRLHGVQATTNPVAPLTIVNGPIRHELGMDGGRNALAPGQHPNGPIGRAVRFVMRNIGGAIGDVDRSTLGSAGKYTYCISELEEESPWEPLSVSLGYERGENVVSVIGVESAVNTIPVFREADPIIEQMARPMRGAGTGIYWSRGNHLFIVNPGHAAIIADAGYSKKDLQEDLYERSKIPLAEWPEGNINQGEWTVEDGKILVTDSPYNIWIMVAGGRDPLHTQFMCGFGVNNGVSERIRKP
jgi:hypothetical protein